MIEIIENENNRILKIDGKADVNISNNIFIQYTAILYKKNKKIETSFIGNIECVRYHHDVGNVGIYVIPLYVLYCDEWHKVINLRPPTNKYFLYPHLLIDPDCYIQYYQPLYFLDTVVNIKISDMIINSKTIDLEEFYQS